MSVNKIFLGTKGNLSIGCICDPIQNKATKYQSTYQSNQVGIPGVREACLNSVLEIMKKYKKTDLEALEKPVEFFVNDSLAQMINCNTYKYWLIAGKKADDEQIDPNEFALWEEFHKLYTKVGLYFVFKRIGSANIANPKFKKIENKYNKYYFDWVWNSIHKLRPNTPANPDEEGIA